MMVSSISRRRRLLEMTRPALERLIEWKLGELNNKIDYCRRQMQGILDGLDTDDKEACAAAANLLRPYVRLLRTALSEKSVLGLPRAGNTLAQWTVCLNNLLREIDRARRDLYGKSNQALNDAVRHLTNLTRLLSELLGEGIPDASE
jgi:hypothetical protein